MKWTLLPQWTPPQVVWKKLNIWSSVVNLYYAIQSVNEVVSPAPWHLTRLMCAPLFCLFSFYNLVCYWRRQWLLPCSTHTHYITNDSFHLRIFTTTIQHYTAQSWMLLTTISHSTECDLEWLSWESKVKLYIMAQSDLSARLTFGEALSCTVKTQTCVTINPVLWYIKDYLGYNGTVSLF